MNRSMNQSGNVITLRVEDITAGDTIPLMLTSDWHYDAPACDRALLKRHMERANQQGAVVLVAGDMFDVMEGKADPRRSKEGIREEYNVEHYFDAIVDDAVSFLRGYPNCSYILAVGNHETAVLKNSHTLMTDRVASGLRAGGITAVGAGYYGWLRVLTYDGGGRGRAHHTTYWHHGNGGSSPVTRGVIETNRQGVYIRDADIILNGHNHNQYHVAIKEFGLSSKGVEYTRVTHFVRTPGYEITGIESGDRYGFDVEKMPQPKPRGSVFASLIYNGHGEFETDMLVKVE